MKLLHITPHLGGGVGKAHAALCAMLPPGVQQTFLLLEEPRDRRHVETIVAFGGEVRVARGLDEVARLARAADIVQFEFWNHPRLFECLARVDFPAIRSVFWSHISGLFKPVIPLGLLAEAGRFVFSTQASYALPGLADLPRDRIAAINSGFGFDGSAPSRAQDRTPNIAYLGTVDFAKMHSGFFDVVDTLDDDVQVSLWGDFNPFGEVLARVLAMKNPQRVRLHGRTATPAQALAEADIFFYPLQRGHYGTAENALVEAMSLGLVPVVLDNPAETAIVRDGQTGLVASSIDECAHLLQILLRSQPLRRRLSSNAIRHIAETRTPAHSVQAFVALWRDLAGERPRQPDFRSAVGCDPADWFLATRTGLSCSPSIASEPKESKGTLAHFESVFVGDPSLARLRAGIRAA